MTRLKIFIAATALLLVMLGAGIFAGDFYFEKMTPSVVSPSVPEGMNVNVKRFLVSPPSIGVAPKTVDTPVTFRAGMANLALPADQGVKVKVGQKALLYDADGNLLDALADIVTVQVHDPAAADSPFAVVMIVSLNNAYPQSTFKSARILVGTDNMSLRLPEGAVIRRADGSFYVWGIDQSGAAEIRDIDISDSFEGAVIFVSRSVSRGNLYILNPDDSLKEGQKINVEDAPYAGPYQLPDVMIARRSQEASRAALNKMARKVASPELYATPKPAETEVQITPTQNMSIACDAPPTDMQVFIGLIKAQPPRPPELPHTEKPLPMPSFPAVIPPSKDTATH